MLRRYLGCFVTSLALCTAQIGSPPRLYTPGGSVYPGAVNQQPDPSAKRYSVSGSVINALTGAPVPRAVVRLQGPEPAQMFSGDDGHFEFKDVLEGRAMLSVQRPGFQNPTRMPQQQVTVGASTALVQLKLMPQSSLHGRVLNSDGEPIEGVVVQIYQQRILNGLRHWIPMNGTSTDETGAYVLEDLAPGPYLVHTASHRVFTTPTPVVVDGRHFPDLYPGQYFPNGPDRASAQPVQVQPGTEAQADFTLTAVPSFSASGTASNGARGLSATCENTEGEVVSNSFRLDSRTGQFTMMQLPAGACTLRLQSGGRNKDGVFGELPINIGAGDISGLQINLEAAADIPVITTANGTPVNPAANPSANPATGQANPKAYLQLIPSTLTDFRPVPTAMDKDGAQVFSGVLPGSYHVSAQAVGGGCLGSVTSGSVDLLRSDLTISPGGSAAAINVTLRTDCGSITAKVDGPTAADPVNIAIVPDGAPSSGRLTYYAGNNIQIQGLTPGDYMLYAAPDLSDFAYADPEVLKTASGQKVTVGPNAQVSVQLQLMNTASETR